MSLFYMGGKIPLTNQLERKAKEMSLLAKRLLLEESGQGMAEYGLILALVALGLIIALGAMKDGIANTFQKTANELNK